MGKPSAADQANREWRRVLDDHAAHTMHRVIETGAGNDWAGQIANAKPGPLMGNRPTVDIEGPDGEWRRYYVRLTEVRP